MFKFMVIKQRTLDKSVSCSGIGLHSGEQAKIKLEPASDNSGIVFERTDISGQARFIKAGCETIATSEFCSAVANDHGVKVLTIEHLMAALSGCSIDNVIVKINKQEVPILDGSSSPFVDMIQNAGVKELNSPRQYIKILENISVEDNSKRLELIPGNTFSINYEINYNDNVIGKQTAAVDINEEVFVNNIAKARTFCFEKEVEALKSRGIIKGGSLRNAVVVGENKVINSDGLRYEDELVRHKILDLIGDLYLMGHPIIGKLNGRFGGHNLNCNLVKKICVSNQSWKLVTVDDIKVDHSDDYRLDQTAAAL